MYRVPTPDNNDLARIADAIIRVTENQAYAPTQSYIKIEPASEFTADHRWDVARFWSEQELVDLGIRPAAIGRNEFIDDAVATINALAIELEASRIELAALTSGLTKVVELSDTNLFGVRSGTRITNTEVMNNRGSVPVYSCFKFKHLTKGLISEAYLKAKAIGIEDSNQTIVTIAANGASVGTVFVRSEKCVLTDDVIVVQPLTPEIDPEYLASELRKKIAAGGFLYEAKLFKGRVEQLTADIPVSDAGTFDLARQQEIAAAEQRFSLIREKLFELGSWSQEARIG